jgi:hypothetical protein
MTELSPHEFTKVLVEDALQALRRLMQDDTPTHRRELARTMFASIEGLVWQLKQDVLKNSATSGLNLYEHAAMLERTYTVDEHGVVHELSGSVPFTNGLRLVARIIERYRPEFKAQFEGHGWTCLKEAIDLRHRLVHPKNAGDLNASHDEIYKIMTAFHWVLHFVHDALKESREALEEEFKRLKLEYAALIALRRSR